MLQKFNGCLKSCIQVLDESRTYQFVNIAHCKAHLSLSLSLSLQIDNLTYTLDSFHYFYFILFTSHSFRTLYI